MVHMYNVVSMHCTSILAAREGLSVDCSHCFALLYVFLSGRQQNGRPQVFLDRYFIVEGIFVAG